MLRYLVCFYDLFKHLWSSVGFLGVSQRVLRGVWRSFRVSFGVRGESLEVLCGLWMFPWVSLGSPGRSSRVPMGALGDEPGGTENTEGWLQVSGATSSATRNNTNDIQFIFGWAWPTHHWAPRTCVGIAPPRKYVAALLSRWWFESGGRSGAW